jgi:hypothetical protein
MNSSQSITIPAAVNNIPGVAEYNGRGKVFACLTTTADFQIRLDDGNVETVSTGTVLGDSTSQPFRTIYFLNSSGNDIVVTFTISNNAINPAVLNNIGSITIAAVKDASTYTKAFAAALIPAGQTVTFNGLDVTRQRRQIVIQNLDAASALSIQDNALYEGFSLAAGRVITLATNGSIKIKNNTLADIACNVLETFYS